MYGKVFLVFFSLLLLLLSSLVSSLENASHFHSDSRKTDGIIPVCPLLTSSYSDPDVHRYAGCQK
jgi:hypothetical protein